MVSYSQDEYNSHAVKTLGRNRDGGVFEACLFGKGRRAIYAFSFHADRRV